MSSSNETLLNRLEDIISEAQEIISQVKQGTSIPSFFPIPPDYVVTKVAEQYDLTPDELKRKTRKRYICEPRQMAMAFLIKYSFLTYEKTGKIFEKDHATVLHAKRTINNLVSRNKTIAARYMDLNTHFINKLKADS